MSESQRGKSASQRQREVERDVAEQLRIQARAYRNKTAGSPKAVARWLRALADKLDKVA